MNEWHQVNEWVELDNNSSSNTRFYHNSFISRVIAMASSVLSYCLFSTWQPEDISLISSCSCPWWVVGELPVIRSPHLLGPSSLPPCTANAEKQRFVIKLSSPNNKHPHQIWTTEVKPGHLPAVCCADQAALWRPEYSVSVLWCPVTNSGGEQRWMWPFANPCSVVLLTPHLLDRRDGNSPWQAL